MSELGLSNDELSEQLGRRLVDPRAISKLRRNAAWSLKRDQTYALCQWTAQHGRALFEVEHHDLWKTCLNSQVRVVRGESRPDAMVEVVLQDFLSQLNSRGIPTLSPPKPRDDVKKIRKYLTESNCVFVGSPHTSPATEIAASLLWDASPWDDSIANTARLPFAIVSATNRYSGVSAWMRNGPFSGFEFKTVTGVSRHQVDWYEPKRFGKVRSERDHDAAVVIVCRRPLGTEKDVTTLIVMGYTGLASLQAAKSLISDDLGSLLLVPGQPEVGVFDFQFSVRPPPKPVDGADHRKPIESSGRWTWLKEQ